MSIVRVKGYGVKRPFQQYFSYIMAVSCIGGRNRSACRQPPTCHRGHIMLYRVLWMEGQAVPAPLVAPVL